MNIVYPEYDYTEFLLKTDRNVYHNNGHRPYLELPDLKKVPCAAPLSLSPRLRDPKFRLGTIRIGTDGRKPFLGHIVLMSQIPITSPELLIPSDQIDLDPHNREILDRQLDWLSSDKNIKLVKDMTNDFRKRRKCKKLGGPVFSRTTDFEKLLEVASSYEIGGYDIDHSNRL